jgi:hypothetical protein
MIEEQAPCGLVFVLAPVAGQSVRYWSRPLAGIMMKKANIVKIGDAKRKAPFLVIRARMERVKESK